MSYISVANAGEKWQLPIAFVEASCKSGVIKGAIFTDDSWMIPEEALPPDKKMREDALLHGGIRRFSTDYPMIIASDLYRIPGTADELLSLYSDNPLEETLLQAELNYYRGNIDEAYRSLISIVGSVNDFNQQLTVGLLISLYAMYCGDISVWNDARLMIASTPCKNGIDAQRRAFWLATADVSIHADNFPDWFRRGSFDFLPRESFPMARYLYAKYIMIKFDDESNYDSKNKSDYISNMKTIASVCEPLISQSKLDGGVISQLYLHLICAIAYHNAGDEPLATEHVDCAIALALPDKLYGPLAEYRRQLDFLMDERLNEIAPIIKKRVRELNKSLIANWITLHNSILNRTVSSELTIREREVAKLAVFGLTNGGIAERLHISQNTVKQAIRSAMMKTGVTSRFELVKFL